MVMEMDEFGHDQLDQLVEAAMKRDEPYVDQNLLGSACVQVGTLDLKPTICYGAYSGLELVPLSSGELKSILNSGPNHQKALEPDEYVYSGSESEDGIPRTSASADRKRFRVAFALAKDVDRYLVCTKILDKTGWKIRAYVANRCRLYAPRSTCLTWNFGTASSTKNFSCMMKLIGSRVGIFWTATVDLKTLRP